eukprot:2532026-Prymnesium_polylepis.2
MRSARDAAASSPSCQRHAPSPSSPVLRRPRPMNACNMQVGTERLDGLESGECWAGMPLCSGVQPGEP